MMSTRNKKSANSNNKEEVSSSERPSSPIRHTVITRIQEKKELQNLNDRLANYIEIVRRLQTENVRLQSQISSTEEIHVKEVTNVKGVYEKEISDTRRMLDSVSRDKAKLELDVGKLQQQNADLTNKLNKREKDCLAKDKRVDDLERKLDNLKNNITQAVADKKRAEEDLNELKNEYQQMVTQTKALQAQLEAETLARVDVENKLQKALDELQFQESLHEQKLIQSRSVNQQAIEEAVTEELREQYEQKLADELRELREDNEYQLKANREELQKKYDNQLAELQKQVMSRAGQESKLRSEIHNLKSRVESLGSRVHELQDNESRLNSKIKDLENMIEQERGWSNKALAEKDAEINKLREELVNYGKDYQDLLDIKVALDMEINAYRKLLEGEETRLNLSMSPDASARIVSPRSTGHKGVKRKRILHEEENRVDIQVNAASDGNVVIDDFDQEGLYVKLHNKGDEDVALGSWQLVKTAGDDTVTFKFHRSLILKPKTSCTIWSAKSNTTHSPPTDLLMKDKNWCTGDDVKAVLITNSGKEYANRTAVKCVRSTLVERVSDGYDEQEEGQGSRENCCVM